MIIKMKKENKKTLLKVILVFISLLIIVVLIIKWQGIGSYSKVFSEIRDINKNTISLDSHFFLHDNVHIMLESTKSENIEDGLEFDIINPKGEIVTSGRLYDNQVIRENYENITGEWKVVLNFNTDSSSFINIGFAVNSKEENNMRMK